MHIINDKIPADYLQTLPDGIKFINKHGKEFFVIEELYCPKGHSIMSETVNIHGEPSIQVAVEIEAQKGTFYIDAFWGSHKKLFDFIPKNTHDLSIVKAFCPVCGESLIVQDSCDQPDCRTKEHIMFLLPGGKNKIFECARLGCPGHSIDIRDLPAQFSRAVSEINYFGVQADEIFRGI